MKRNILTTICLFSVLWVAGQDPAIRMEELTAPEFIKAVEKSSGTCILPIGVFEKHGPHLPLGTDLFLSRELATQAASKEYTVVFPWYYFSQINEAKHQPGTIAYTPDLIWKILQETLDNLSRNGFKKIIIVNGHGGNNAFLNYFGMAQLSERRNYSLYWFRPEEDPDVAGKVEILTQKDTFDAHAGNSETSEMLAVRPDLVHQERAGMQSGKDQKRMKDLDHVYTGIWWYASYPNQYGGDGSKSSEQAGKILIGSTVDQLVDLIRKVKADTIVPGLQEQFFKESENPLKTKQ